MSLTLGLFTLLEPTLGYVGGSLAAFVLSTPVFFLLAWVLFYAADQPSIRLGKALFCRIKDAAIKCFKPVSAL